MRKSVRKPEATYYRLLEVAEERGVSLRQLALRAGVTEPRVRAIAHNRGGNVTVLTLEKLALVLGVPVSELLTTTPLEVAV